MRVTRLFRRSSYAGERLVADRRGATAVEYGFILALIVLAVIGSIRLVANETVNMWGNIQTRIGNATGY